MRKYVLPLLLDLACASAAPVQNVRLTNDVAGGYISAYTLATGIPYSDAVIAECAVARGRQNEPAVAVDPRNPNVLIGSSNDYCGVYAGSPAGNFIPAGPIWLGYYRSENGGSTFQSSLVPGYPGDTSPYAALAKVRTASAGDPVIAWDGHGRVFMASESSGDPAGTAKTFGDEWVAAFDNPQGEGGPTKLDGKRFVGSTIVAKGSSAPNLAGKFNDKTALEADRTGGACDGSVYFAWSRFTGIGISNIYFSRSTDHGATWSAPALLTNNLGNVQDPSIAVTGNGNVYVTFDVGALVNGQPNGVGVVKSTTCGATFGQSSILTTYIPYTAMDIQTPQPVPAGSAIDDPLDSSPSASGALARDCGDFANACQSGYTFFRRSTSTVAKADQKDQAHEYVYLVFDATKPGTEVSTGTTYGSLSPGVGSQSLAYFVRYDGATGLATSAKAIDLQPVGHQIFPSISADGGVLHALWWDSRHDPNYSPARPVGNDAAGNVGPALDVFSAHSTDGGATWSSAVRLTGTTTSPNYEQFSDRTVPFAGDYLWITSLGDFAFGVWTDWRNTVAGPDPREGTGSTEGADVKQCRTFSAATGWTGDECPHDGGLDQNIYGARAQ